MAWRKLVPIYLEVKNPNVKELLVLCKPSDALYTKKLSG